jgi:selenide,water dikinase
VLTKPLGIGCLTTALKQGAAEPEHIEAGHRIMARLNRHAAEAMLRAGVHAATDVTGYGLLGHAYEMAEGAGLSIHIRARDVPVLEEARPYVDVRFSCGGSKRNEAYSDGRVQIGDGVTEQQRMILHDVQTSGGLLLATPPEACESLVADLQRGGDVHTAAIGEILSGGPPIVVS